MPDTPDQPGDAPSADLTELRRLRTVEDAARELSEALDDHARANAYNGDHARRRQERASDDVLGAWATLRAALAGEATEPPPDKYDGPTVSELIARRPELTEESARAIEAMYRDTYARLRTPESLTDAARRPSPALPHDHNAQLSHLIDEWGLLGVVLAALAQAKGNALDVLAAAAERLSKYVDPATGEPVWCAKHREGWCAISGNEEPAEGAGVETLCGYAIPFPAGFDHRRPTCDGCLTLEASLAAHGPMPAPQETPRG